GCDALEKAALLFAGAGAVQDMEAALESCVEAARRAAAAVGELSYGGDARNATTMPAGSFAASPPSDSHTAAAAAAAEVAAEVFGVMAGKAGKTGPQPQQLLRCLEARTPVYRALAAAGPAALNPRLISPSSRRRRLLAAVYRYIGQLEGMPYCRLAFADSAVMAAQEGGGERGSAGAGAAAVMGMQVAGGGSSPHTELIHVIQASDAEDPWLQAEWGRTLRPTGRSREAALHLSVAAALLQRHLQAMQVHAHMQQTGGEKHMQQADTQQVHMQVSSSASAPSPSPRVYSLAAAAAVAAPGETGAANGVGKRAAAAAGASTLRSLGLREALEGFARAVEEAAALRPG
ncbi:hypothetical protein Agub_g320, partial [Astrephomene gubernaculifera]